MDNKNPQNTSNPVILRTVVVFIICVALLFLLAQFDAIKNVITYLADMMMPVLTGVIVAYILNPLTVFVEKKVSHLFVKNKKIKDTTRKRIARGVGIITALVVMFAVVSLLMFLIIPEFLENVYKLVDMAPELFEKAQENLSKFGNSDNVIVKNIAVYADKGIESVVSFLGERIGNAVTSLIESVVSAFSFVFDLMIAFVICVYALLEKDSFVSQSKKILYAVFSRRTANDIIATARYGNEVFGKYISGKLLTSTIVGVVTFAFMTIMGMPYTLLSAGIIAVTNVIPFFGPFIGGIPTAFIILVTDLKQGLIYVVFLIILQQIEGNIIEPMVMEDKTGVSKFWITFALILCGGLFGIPGMIFSAPVFAVLFYCIKVLVERSLKSKGLPLSSSAYLNVGSIDEHNGEFHLPPTPAPNKSLTQALKEWWERIQNGNVVIADPEEKEEPKKEKREEDTLPY